MFPSQDRSTELEIDINALIPLKKGSAFDDELFFSICANMDAQLSDLCHFDSWNPSAPFYRGQKSSTIEPDHLYQCYMDTYQSFKRLQANDSQCTNGTWAGMCKKDRMCTIATVRNSFYAIQLVSWLTYFPLENILIVRSEDFYSHTNIVMKEIQEFLGLPDFEWNKITDKAFNIMNPAMNKDAVFNQKTGGLSMGQTSVEKVSDYPDMNPKTRRILSKFFQPYNEKLSELLNLPFHLWEDNYEMGQ